MAAPKAGTRDKLLDVAEQVFASAGYDGASLRTITNKARVTVGSINYHFQSKEQLFEEVLRRRFETLAADRLARLGVARADAKDGQPTVEAVVEALALPFLERCMKGGKGWRNYSLILARHMYSRHWYERLFAELYDPGAKQFLAALKSCFPEATDEDVGYAWHFLLGAMVHCCADLETRRIDRLTEGICTAANYEAILPRFILFASAGITAIAGGFGQLQGDAGGAKPG